MSDNTAENEDDSSSHNCECRCHPWHRLPRELKLEILQYLTLPMLRRFMFLSKECLSLVLSMRLDAMSIHLDDNTFIGNRKDSITVRVSRRIRTPYLSCFVTHYDLQFHNLEGGGCFVARDVIEDKRKVMKVGMKYSSESSVSAAVRVFAQLLKWMHTESLHIAMSPTTAEVEQMLKVVPRSQRFPCKSFGIETKNPALVNFFLQHLQPGCSLVINEYTQLDGDECILGHDFFDTDIAKLSPCMSFNGMTEVTDDQLLHLQADTLFLVGRHITSRAVNEIILEWIEGKRKIVQMFFDAIQSPSEKEVLANLDQECFRTAEELLDIVTEVSQWRVRELSRPWVGLQSKSGMAMIVKVGNHSCSLINLDLK